jgi:putative transposase
MSPVLMLDWRLRKGAISLARRLFKPEQIINNLREAEVLISQGSTIGQASRKTGVTEQTCYRWRREYGGMRVEQARRLREPERENSRLKRLVADLSLKNAFLKEAARGNS